MFEFVDFVYNSIRTTIPVLSPTAAIAEQNMYTVDHILNGLRTEISRGSSLGSHIFILDKENYCQWKLMLPHKDMITVVTDTKDLFTRYPNAKSHFTKGSITSIIFDQSMGELIDQGIPFQNIGRLVQTPENIYFESDSYRINWTRAQQLFQNN